MGQKPSYLGGRTNRPKLPLSWILRGQQTTHNPNPEQPIKFQYKTKRKSIDSNATEKSVTSNVYPNNSNVTSNNRNTNSNVKTFNNLNNNSSQSKNNTKLVNVDDVNCQVVKVQNIPTRTKSEPSLIPEKSKHRRRRKSARSTTTTEKEKSQKFGYEIEDVDAFLAKASIEKPANIPVVLAFPSVLYQTRIGGYQAEISLPLGMVVNAVFKNQNWLYVQTPHAEEGYVSYPACLPLGIIPPPADSPAPCWENSTDVFPKPSGNMTDTEKLSSKSECSAGRCRSRRSRNAASICDEHSVDRLYLRAAACAKNRGTRQTLLVVGSDYEGNEGNTLTVLKGDVVVLRSTQFKDWFWVRNRNGMEGFIPAAVAGHGFL